MKNSIILITVLAGFLFTSCNKEEDEIQTQSQSITEEEAVQVVQSSLSEESAGLTENSSEFTKVFEDEISKNAQCNQTVTETYTYSHNGTFAQAEYKYNWSYTLTCNGLGIPQSASFSSNGNGTFKTSRIESNDSSTFSASVVGLQPTSSVMTYNVTYKRLGSQQLTTNQNTRNVNSELNSTLVDLVVRKSNYQVSSGSGTFTLSGSTNQGNFSYTGSIVFKGNKTATITINGNEYNIDLN